MLQPFITPVQLKSYAAVSASIETDFLLPFISTVQEMVVVPILGIALATEISNQLLSGNTLSAANQVLVTDHILPLLAYATWSQASVFGGIKMYKKSLVKPVDPNSDALNVDEMRFYKANIDNMVNFYKQRLFDHLEADAATQSPIYPLYRSTQQNEYRGTGNATMGIYFKKRGQQ